jgi:SH3 domain protein
MMFHISISSVNISYRDTVCRSVAFVFFLITFLPLQLQAETVYITDSLLVGLHEEKSIDSAILKVLPTGTALEVIERVGESVNVLDTAGDFGWISNSYLISNDPKKNGSMDSSAAQERIRALEAELQNAKVQEDETGQDPTKNTNEIIKLKTENESLKQQQKSDKLKSGELQANLAELRNQISQSGSNQQFTDKIKLLTETNTQLEDDIKQLQAGSKTTESAIDSIYHLLIASSITLLIGLLVGIIIMISRERRRLGGLKL